MSEPRMLDSNKVPPDTVNRAKSRDNGFSGKCGYR